MVWVRVRVGVARVRIRVRVGLLGFRFGSTGGHLECANDVVERHVISGGGHISSQ
jgi:hypothetical protein